MSIPPTTHDSAAGNKDVVMRHALNLPCFNKLRGKRVILASASPRRIDILRTLGLDPEIVPSTFPEELCHGEFDSPADYCVATGSAKGVEVYQRLVLESPENPPDLVIGADTIVVLPAPSNTILEKPRNVLDQIQMLEDCNGATVQIITSVTLVQPTVAMPGYSLTSLVISTKVVFDDNSPDLIQAYVDSKEGLDRAGGFAIQGLGGLLIKEIRGDYNSCVGFPGQAFVAWLAELAEEGTLCELD